MNLLRPIAPIVLMALIVLSFVPDVLHALPEGWRISPVVVRTVAILGLVVLLVQNAKDLARRNQERKRTIANFANTVGGRFSDAPYRVTESGWEGGPRLDYSVSGRPVALSLTRAGTRGGSSGMYARITAEFSMTRDLQFQIMPGGNAMRFILSKTFMGPAIQLAVKSAGAATISASARVTAAQAGIDLSSRESLQKQLMDRLGYLTSDPITVGEEAFDREFLVKASDPSLGRALVSDVSVLASLKSLRERSAQFQVGLECMSGSGGPSKLVVGISSFDFTTETLAAMDAATRAILESLSRQDLLSAERGGRGAA